MEETKDTVAYAWPALEATRTYTGDDLYALPSDDLSPAWKMLLASDASPTRTFHVLSGSKTVVKVLDEVDVADGDVPTCVRDSVEGPYIRRRVFLENDKGFRYGYAISWWNKALYHQMMPDPSRPIGGMMASSMLEVHRRIQEVVCGSSSSLTAAFGCRKCDGPDVTKLWGRMYVMSRSGKPFTVINEIFSPELSDFLT